MQEDKRKDVADTKNGTASSAVRRCIFAMALIALAYAAGSLPSQANAQSNEKGSKKSLDKVWKKRSRQPRPATRNDMLLGAYGPYRANNDLLSYALNIRVDPSKKSISGKNTVTFRMLKDGSRIQLDLVPALDVDKILLGSQKLEYSRAARAVFIDFPKPLKKGHTYSIDFYYSGTPVQERSRSHGLTFGTDPDGRPWVYTANEGSGSSTWWPSKDQARDEVENMTISVEVPNGLTDVSNGRFVGKQALDDGYTRWKWAVHYPINSYDVALNIGHYTHFSDRYGDLTLDYYVLPENLAKAKAQFAQVKGMLEAFTHYFDEYPFAKDGYKLVEVPYLGMEHQSAVAYGNHYQNGYLGRDWAGTGTSLKFDFIIIHESGHEWFGNSVTAADPVDMWIQEGWTTYMEALYVEHRWDYKTAIEYLNGLKPKIVNRNPIVIAGNLGLNKGPLDEDQYFKGALMINTLRSVINDDARWFSLIRGFYRHFKYQTISTDDVVNYFNKHTGMNLTPIFNQYLRHADIPTLEVLFGESPGLVMYKWKAAEDNFAMPVRVGQPGHWKIIHPTTTWQWMKTSLTKSQFKVATKLYYVNVNKQ